MANLKYGSTGNDVKKLQQALYDAGYTDVGKADGVFGQKTLAAVKAYQKDNNLAVDGIAGNLTQGSLYGNGTTTKAATTKTTVGDKASTKDNGKSNSSSGGALKNQTPTKVETNKVETNKTPTTTTTTPTTPTRPVVEAPTVSDYTYDNFSYGSYAQSDTVQQAHALLQQHSANKPGAYQSQWQDQLNEYMNKIQNRDPFSYDFNADALYQQYKDNYIQQGQMAMMDTMGQAAAMTGGYGNSYAQTVGQQAYNQQLNQLNDIMPELYQQAYNRYADEGQQLYDQYNLLMGREEQDYGRYQNDVNNWYNQLEYLTNRYESERAFDYGQYEADRALAHGDWELGVQTGLDTWRAQEEAKLQAWATETGLDIDEYMTQLNQQYNAEQAELDRQHQAEQNQLDRDQTDKWNQKELEQKQSSLTSGNGNGNVGTTYREVSYSDSVQMEKEFARATTVEDINYIANKLKAMGYDPEFIKSLAQQYASKLQNGSDKVDTTVEPTSVVDPWKERQATIRGGMMGTY